MGRTANAHPRGRTTAPLVPAPLVPALLVLTLLTGLVEAVLPTGAAASPRTSVPAEETFGRPEGPTVVVGEPGPARAGACPEDLPDAGFTDRGETHGASIDCLVAFGITRGTTPTTFGTGAPVTRQQAALLVARMLMQVPGFTVPPVSPARFPDLVDGPFAAAVDALGAFDPPIIAGKPDGRFAPGDEVTRAQLASLLVRTHDELVAQFPAIPPLPAATTTGVSDLDLDEVHGPEVARLTGAGVVAGFPDGRFGPGLPVTRGQAASLLVRHLDLLAAAGVLRTPGGPLPAPEPVPTPDTPADPASVVVRGSIEQVAVIGADPDTPVTLLDPDGRPVRSDALDWELDGEPRRAGGDRTDAEGSIVIRGTLDDRLAYSGVAPGEGYTVRYVEQGTTRVSEPVTVLAADGPPPPPAFYAAQQLDEGLTTLTTRDGTQLSAFVTLPGPPEDGPYPTLIEYSGYDVSAPPATSGLPISLQAPTLAIGQLLDYATVAVNLRGTGCSGGAFDHLEPAQALDGYDAVEVVAAQPWSGNVATTGVSYPGITQLFLAATQPPSLTAAAPIAVVSDHALDTVYPGGIFNTGFAVDWARERERDTRFPGGQAWVDELVAGDSPQAATCRDNVRLRGQNLPLLDRIVANPDRTELWDPRTPADLAERITTDLLLVNAWQDEQTGGRAAALLDALDLTRNDRLVRFVGTNGTHVEALGPVALVELIEFLELLVAGRTPQLTERDDYDLIRLLLPVVYAQLLGETLPITDLPIPDDRFAGLTHEQALAAYRAEPPAHLLFESGAGPGPDGFPYPRFSQRVEFAQLPNLDSGFDADASAWYLGAGGQLTRQPPSAAADATPAAQTAYVYDPAASPVSSFAERPSTSEVWRLQPDYRWLQPPEGRHAAFATPPLDEDLVLAGSAAVELWLATDHPLRDTDVEVVLSELRPDGTERYLTTGWLRGSRRALAAGATVLRPAPSLLAADRAPLDEGFNLLAVETFPFADVLRAGSRLRLTVEAPGGNRPLWAFAEPVPGGPEITNRIAHHAAAASRVVLPVLEVDLEVPPGPPACAPSDGPDGGGFTSVRGQPCRTAPTG